MAEVGGHATLQMVADRSGLTANAMYHYFASKEALFDAVVELNDKEFWTTMSSSVRDATTLSEELVAVIDALGEFMHRNPTFSVLLARAMPRVMLEPRPLEGRARDFCEGFAHRAVTRGEISEVQRDWLVGLIASNLMGAVMVQPGLRAHALNGLRWFFAHAALVANASDTRPEGQARRSLANRHG
jgi:AcrR family transcriptional regulator